MFFHDNIVVFPTSRESDLLFQLATNCMNTSEEKIMQIIKIKIHPRFKSPETANDAPVKLQT